MAQNAKSGVSRYWPALLVVLALAPFTWIAASFSDLPQFGKYQDDGLFVVAGKSLHDTGQYRIVSLPGAPFQTKFQPLYSALLAGIWTIDGKFPENLRLIAALQWAIFVAFIFISWRFFRSLDFSEWQSAGMCCFIALCPWALYWALLPISDFLFSALVVATFYILRRHPADSRWWWIAGCAGAAAYLTKSAGMLIIPAVFIGGWRARRMFLAFRAITPMICAMLIWTAWAHFHRAQSTHPVMWYYTDYIAAHVRNGGIQALPAIAQANALSLIATAGNAVLFDFADSVLGRFLSILIFAIGVLGGVRISRRSGSIEYPVFCGLLVLLLLVWNFDPNIRLLSPALPLLAIGLCLEAENMARLVNQSRRSPKSSDRIASYGIAAVLAAGCAYAVFANGQFLLQRIPALLARDRASAANRQAAIDWCARSLPRSAVVLAFNDTLFYLYTGLHAVRPMPNSVSFYIDDHAGELANFTHFDQLAAEFGITHILLTNADFEMFAREDRKLIERLLRDDPRRRKIYAAGDCEILQLY